MSNKPKIKSIQKFDKQFWINLIVIKHKCEISLEKTLQLFSTKNNVLYINALRLIYNYFYNNDSFAKKFEII